MSATKSIARFSPMGIPASIIEELAMRSAIARGLLSRGDHLCALDPLVQRALRDDARLAIQLAVRGPAETVIINLRRTLTTQLFGGTVKFDQLTIEERHEVADVAFTAWQTMLDVLAGQSPAIPAWEFACLTFSGPYDPSLLTAKVTVQ